MKQKLAEVILTAALCFSLAACGNSSQPQTASAQQSSEQNTDESAAESTDNTTAQAETSQEQEKNKVARDDAEMQTEDKSMPTRIPPENGTKINLYFGDTLITGVLNDSETAQAMIARLPMGYSMADNKNLDDVKKVIQTALDMHILLSGVSLLLALNRSDKDLMAFQGFSLTQ